MFIHTLLIEEIIPMEKKDNLTKGLAMTGTILTWLPILAPIVLSGMFFLVERVFRFDYLMPAELAFLVLLGGGLLLWAAFRARSHRGLIGWSLVIAAAALAGSQGLAVLTGLASGEHEAVGWRFAVVVSLLAVYILAVIVVAVGGILLCRDLWRPSTLLPKVA